MKVGTDAVLLGAWVNLNNVSRLLDIGTGSGVIAIMAAQRTTHDCQIDGIEIQAPDCAQATANANASPWAQRIRIVHTALQDFHPPYRYDVIVCNPPYFINSLQPPTNGRTTARHTVSLDHDALVTAVDRLLSPTGRASFIMPSEEGNQFRMDMKERAMQLTRITYFRSRRERKIERFLMTFMRQSAVANDPIQVGGHNSKPILLETEVLLYEEGNRWTKDYTELTQDFYLTRP